MSDLQLFQNPEFGRVRIVEANGEAWMVGKDVAEALGHTNPQRAIREYVDGEDKGVRGRAHRTKGQVMDDLEKVETIRTKCNVSYTDAKAALDADRKSVV